MSSHIDLEKNFWVVLDGIQKTLLRLEQRACLRKTDRITYLFREKGMDTVKVARFGMAVRSAMILLPEAWDSIRDSFQAFLQSLGQHTRLFPSTLAEVKFKPQRKLLAATYLLIQS